MKSFSIILLCIIIAICYGIVHDQITARICVEYFTIGHPNIFGTDNPTILGVGWGIVATWWVGALLGIPLAFAAQYGQNPKRSITSLIRPIGILIVIMTCSAALAGVIGFFVAKAHIVFLEEPLASKVPIHRHTAFLTDLWIHSASYGTGFLGGIVLCWKVWRDRNQ